MTFAQELLNNLKIDSNFLQGIIASDEIWLYGYDVKIKISIIPREGTKRLTSEGSTPNSVKYNDCAYCFIQLEWRDSSWVLASGHTINKEFYIKLHDFCITIMHTCAQRYLLPFFLDKNNIIMSQPSYSPSFPPVTFAVPKTEKTHEWLRFTTMEEIKTASPRKFKIIPKSTRTNVLYLRWLSLNGTKQWTNKY